jgi:hypothetical protein
MVKALWKRIGRDGKKKMEEVTPAYNGGWW